jgi:hypothetical protein
MNKKIIVALLLVALVGTSVGAFLFMSNDQDNQNGSNNLDGYAQLPEHKFRIVDAELKEILPDNEYIEFITVVDDSIVFVMDEMMYITDSEAKEEPKEVFELINFEYMITAGKNYAVYESFEHELVAKWNDKTHVLDAFELEHGMLSVEIDAERAILYYIKLEKDTFQIIARNLETTSETIIATQPRNNIIMDFRVDNEGQNLSYITYSFPAGTDMEDEDIWYLDEYEDHVYWIDLGTRKQTKVELDIKNAQDEKIRIWDVHWLNPKDLLVGVVYTEQLRHISYIYNIDSKQYDMVAYNDRDFWIYHNSKDGKQLLGVEIVETEDLVMSEAYNIWYYNVPQNKYVQLTEYKASHGLLQDRRPILKEDSNLVAFERWKGYVLYQKTEYRQRIDLMVTTLEGEHKTLVEGFVELNIVGWVDENKLLIIGAEENEADIKFYIVTIK